MAAGPGLAPHRPGTSGQAGSSTPGSLALVLCWYVKKPAAVAVEGPWFARKTSGVRIGPFSRLAGLGWVGEARGAAISGNKGPWQRI